MEMQMEMENGIVSQWNSLCNLSLLSFSLGLSGSRGNITWDTGSGRAGSEAVNKEKVSRLDGMAVTTETVYNNHLPAVWEVEGGVTGPRRSWWGRSGDCWGWWGRRGSKLANRIAWNWTMRDRVDPRPICSCPLLFHTAHNYYSARCRVKYQ